LKAISTTDVKEVISTMGYLFAAEDIVDHTITATDSNLIKAKGPVWHKSSLKKGVVPRSGIDTDARWGYSHTKGLIFGYKLHLTYTTGEIIVPLTADVTTTANVLDNMMYIPLTTSSLVLSLLSENQIVGKITVFNYLLPMRATIFLGVWQTMNCSTH
jgi:hypothetical protein